MEEEGFEIMEFEDAVENSIQKIVTGPIGIVMTIGLVGYVGYMLMFTNLWGCIGLVLRTLWYGAVS